MHTAEDLATLLRRIDGKGYKAYKDCSGTWEFDHFTLFIDHVQGDPFAAPSRMRVRVPMKIAGFPDDTYSGKSREIALRDFLTRRFGSICRGAKKRGGSGKSGIIDIDMPGQEVIERTSCVVTSEYVEARFIMGLPAFGRKIAGRIAEKMFSEELPFIVEGSLTFSNLKKDPLYEHVQTAEDADFLRSSLKERGLVSFVSDEAVLPRRSGVDERPMAKNEAVLFTSPDSFRITFDLPNRGELTGMGIPKGITLIVGGGYHGKSTLLNAVEQGVYNHIPGDGRELVVTDPEAYKIRAEDGRRIEKTAITPFISNLPYGRATDSFSSENASGVSTVLVIGGSGDYFDVADTVISMNAYIPEDVTSEAKKIAGKYRTERTREGGDTFGSIVERAPLASGIDPSKGKRDVKITVRGPRLIEFGTERIDLTSIEQLIHPGQARAIAEAMVSAKRAMDGKKTLKELLDEVMSRIDREGLDAVGDKKPGDLVRFRRLELAAALNRLRSFEVKQVG